MKSCVCGAEPSVALLGDGCRIYCDNMDCTHKPDVSNNNKMIASYNWQNRITIIRGTCRQNEAA